MYHYKYIHVVLREEKELLINIFSYSDISFVRSCFFEIIFHIKSVSTVSIFFTLFTTESTQGWLKDSCRAGCSAVQATLFEKCYCCYNTRDTARSCRSSKKASVDQKDWSDSPLAYRRIQRQIYAVPASLPHSEPGATEDSIWPSGHAPCISSSFFLSHACMDRQSGRTGSIS